MSTNHQQYLSSLHPGQTVDIQRSNGRIHQAIITKINQSAKTLTVEWQEKNDMKGKEVDLDTIMPLNPNLFTSINGAHNHQPNNENSSNGNTVRRNKQDLRRQSQPVPAPNYNSDGSPTRTAILDPNKSKVVKQIERIAVKREQRRVKQEERRHRLNEVDHSIPAWEFQAMITEYRQQYEITYLTINDQDKDLKICVCVRKRPITKKELNKKDIDVLTIPTKDVVIVHLPKVKVDLTKYIDNQKFRFDYVFHESSNNELVYHFTARPLVQSLFQGNNPMVFAYGQTGSGKFLHQEILIINFSFRKNLYHGW
jgi:kinesin family protein 2/24